ncbi:MAG: hypothetical protein AABX00_00595 [Nanoarchaeota archaeon]
MSYANQVIDYVSKLYRETKAGAQIMFNPTHGLEFAVAGAPRDIPQARNHEISDAASSIVSYNQNISNIQREKDRVVVTRADGRHTYLGPAHINGDVTGYVSAKLSNDGIHPHSKQLRRIVEWLTEMAVGVNPRVKPKKGKGNLS